jgi:hypothetical protein
MHAPTTVLASPPRTRTLSRRAFLVLGLAVGSATALATRAEGQDRAAAKPPPQLVIHGHTKSVEGLAVTPDGRTLISASRDGTVKLWTLPDGQLIGTQEGHDKHLRAVALGREGKVLASGGGKKQIRLWTLEKNEEDALEFRGGAQELVCSLASTPDDRILISGGNLGSVNLWDWDEGTPLAALEKKHDGGVLALAVSHDSKFFVSSAGGRIQTWSLPGGKPLVDIPPHKGRRSSISTLAVTPDNRKYIISGSVDGVVGIWSSVNGRLVWELKESPDHKRAHDKAVTALAIASEGKSPLLVSASQDKTIKLWSLANGEFVDALGEHSKPITALAVTADGQTVISGDEDGVVRLWNVASRQVQSFLFDKDASGNNAVLHEVEDRATGRRLLYALPLGYAVSPNVNVRIVSSMTVKGCNKEKATPQGGAKGPTQKVNVTINIQVPRSGPVVSRRPPAVKPTPVIKPKPPANAKPKPKPLPYRPAPNPPVGRRQLR